VAFQLSLLRNAPEPAVVAKTLSVRHGKHHQAYVDKTYATIEGPDHADRPSQALLAAALRSKEGLFCNSAQTSSHAFYWNSLSPFIAVSETEACADA